MSTGNHAPSRSFSLAFSLSFILTWLTGQAQNSSANDNAPVEKATQKIIKLPTEGFVWPNQPPKDCPFEQSKQLGGVYFTGTYHTRGYGDTWYPSGRPTAIMYSPWTDGTTEGMTSVSIENDTDWKIATTGNAVMIGDDPQNLIVKNTSPPQKASPKPFEGRYPCGSLVYNGVWYYGTYCLGPPPDHEARRLRLQLADPGTDARLPHLDRLRQDLDALAAFAREAALPRAGETLGRGEDGRAALRRFRQEHGAFARRQGVPGRHGRGRERSEAALRQFELDLGRSGLSRPGDAEHREYQRHQEVRVLRRARRRRASRSGPAISPRSSRSWIGTTTWASPR